MCVCDCVYVCVCVTVSMCARVCVCTSYDQRTVTRNATPTVSSFSSPSIFIMTVPNHGSRDLLQPGPSDGDIGQIPPIHTQQGPVVQSTGEGAGGGGERETEGDREGGQGVK